MAGYDDKVKKIFARKILWRLSEGVAYNSKKKKTRTYTYIFTQTHTNTYTRKNIQIHTYIYFYVPREGRDIQQILHHFPTEISFSWKKTKFCRIKNQKILFRGFVSTEIRISYPDIELLILAVWKELSFSGNDKEIKSRS